MRAPAWFVCGVCAGALVLPFALDALSLTLLGADDDETRWVTDGVQRKGQIAERTAMPQILIAGGSNANYGYSAALLTRELSVPATNLAVHAGLGRRYIFWDALRHGKRGDLVILALEYELYGEPTRDPAERYQAFSHDRAYYEQLPWLQRGALLGSMSPADWLGRWRAQLRPRPPGVDAFSLTLDDRGDEVGNTRTDVTLREGPPTLVVLDPSFGADLRDFAQVLRARGADVVIAFPNLREAEFRRRITPTLIEGIRGAAEKASVAVIGTPESAAFRDEDAYDTNYHVKAAATQVATHRLASQLREAGVELPARAAS